MRSIIYAKTQKYIAKTRLHILKKSHSCDTIALIHKQKGDETMEKLSFHHLPKYSSCNFRTFEEGESHITRMWDQNVLIFMLEGTLHFTENGVPVSVCKNHYYIQKARLRQSADRPSECPRYFYIHFWGNVEETDDGLPLEGKFDPQTMLPLFREMEKICKDPIRTRFEKRYIFYKLLSVLDSSQKKLVSPRRALAERMHDIILAESASPFSMEELSERLSYSKNYLIDVFKQTYGTTPYKYVNLMRLENACQLLITTEKSCQAISDECGFSEYSLFYKLFRAQFGCSPQLYRRRVCMRDE